MSKLPLIPCAIIIGLAGVTTAILTYVRADLFTIQHTLPSTLIYFSLMAYILSLPFVAIRRIGREKVASDSNKTEEFKDGRWSKGIVGELAVLFGFTLLSIAVGAVSALMWWGLGGYEIRTLFEALQLGAILGALAVGVLSIGF